jgi:hypothetical protein
LCLVAGTSQSIAFMRLAPDPCAIPIKGNLRFGSWFAFRFDGRDQQFTLQQDHHSVRSLRL